MSVVIIGAGEGLGAALARRFGSLGHEVGLIARNAARLAGLAERLRADGVVATAHPADVTDADGLRAALDATAPVDVLIWAVGPGSTPINPADQVTPTSVNAQFAVQVGGAVTAVQHVLPAMTARGEGTVLVATGASSVLAIPQLGDVGIAMAGLRNWVLGLRTATAGTGVHVATVTIGVLIDDPDAVAEHFVALNHAPERAEETVGDLDELRRLVGVAG